MRALYKRPEDPKFREIIAENELKPLQNLVGGNIETLTIATDSAIICNEAGWVEKLKYNCEFCGINFVGPILIVGVDGEEFTDCPMSVTVANGGIE